MKIKFKYLLVASVLYLIAEIVISELYDKRPIKFHLYKSHLQFKEYIADKFAVGSDLGQALETLQRSSATCYIETNKTTVYHGLLKNTRFVVTCTYTEPFISLYPFMCYTVIMEADENLAILISYGSRTKNYELWW